MKKIKLFALAVCAMLSTNAFAQTEDATSLFKFTYSGDEATIIGFTSTPDEALVKNLVIPATVPTSASPSATKKVVAIGPKAFQNNKKIETVTIDDENVATISGGAFAGCTNLTTVTIGKSVKNIVDDTEFTVVAAATALTATDIYYTSAVGAGRFAAAGTETAAANQYWTGATPIGAFKGCTKLATVNFETPAFGTFTAIEAGTFEGTAIATLDLTASHVQVVKQWFEEMNTNLTTIKLPASLTTIEANAFKNLATLATINFDACSVNNFTIGANAFSGAPLIKTLTLPAKLASLDDAALAGSNIQTLTITSNDGANLPALGDQTGATKLTTLIVNGEFKGTIGKYAALTSATFNGKVSKAGAIETGAFVACSELATVEFKGEMIAGAVATGSFGTSATVYAGKDNPAGTQLTITYKPETTVTALAFVKTAFLAASVTGATDYKAKLATTTAYRDVLVGDGYSVAANLDYIGIKIDAAAATFNLNVATGGSSKYYYAKFYSGTNYKIAKKQGDNNDVNVIVYQAYVDQSDATIYMENLHIVEGYYWIPAGNPVIVKSTSSNPVVITESDNSKTSIVYGAPAGVGTASTNVNDLLTFVTAGDRTGISVKDNTTDGYKSYALAPIDQAGYLWAGFKDERVLVGTNNGAYNNITGDCTVDFVVECKILSAADRLNVVWLDGSEEDQVTAIKAVKTAAEKGAIYNLAGQKVSAAYKGVVIKDGKKYIQK